MMSVLQFGGLVLALAVVAGSAPAQSPCLASGAMVSGNLQQVTASHPNGSQFTTFMLILAPPRCVQTESERVPGARRIQLGGSAEQQAALRRRVNAPLSVRIRDPFTPETAWHVGDVVVVDYDIVN